MRKDHLFNYRSIAAIVAFVCLFALMIASVPAQASPALQLTPGPTVVVPTVVIPNTGGDTTVVVTPLFSNWLFWAALALILLVVVIALLARPTITHTHYHDDEHI